MHDSNPPALRENTFTLQQMSQGKFLLFFTNESDRKFLEDSQVQYLIFLLSQETTHCPAPGEAESLP